MQIVAGTSSIQTISVVTQVSSILWYHFRVVFWTVTQPAMVNQPSDVLGVITLIQPTGQVISVQDGIGATASSDVQFARLVGQPVSSKMSLPPVSLTGVVLTLRTQTMMLNVIVSLPPLLSTWKKRVRYLVVGPVLKTKTSFRGFETEQNLDFVNMH